MQILALPGISGCPEDDPSDRQSHQTEHGRFHETRMRAFREPLGYKGCAILRTSVTRLSRLHRDNPARLAAYRGKVPWFYPISAYAPPARLLRAGGAMLPRCRYTYAYTCGAASAGPSTAQQSPGPGLPSPLRHHRRSGDVMCTANRDRCTRTSPVHIRAPVPVLLPWYRYRVLGR